MKDNILYMVIPCYNEEEVLPETSKQLGDRINELKKSGKIDEKSRILFVNDGSKDSTWDIISQLHEKDPELYSGLNLSRNRGHQCAVLAGLMYAKEHSDMAISMDADLQDDINAIDAMVDKYLDGCDIVYGVRSSRQTDSFFKRFTAEAFYRIMNFFGAQTIFNHADFRLMSRRALEGLEQFDEVNLFLRGIVPLIGYRTDVVYYERSPRFAGESKYPLSKMLNLAIEGITSFSIKPLRMIMTAGVISLIAGFILLIYTIIAHFVSGMTGCSAVLISLWMICGLILIALGVLGEYIGRMYMEVKHRPNFIVERVLDEIDE